MRTSRKRASLPSQSRVSHQPTLVHTPPPPPPPPPPPSPPQTMEAVSPPHPSPLPVDREGRMLRFRLNTEKKEEPAANSTPQVEAPVLVEQTTRAMDVDAPVEKMTKSSKAAAAASTSSAAPGRFFLRSQGPVEEDKRAAKETRPRGFRLPLFREEIMADFISITGRKLPHRPKRRPKAVQEKLHGLFPGSDLPAGITASRYRVKHSSG